MIEETYSDGRGDVPGGVAGPVERVVVVGAGIAGLTVANALANAGVECVVVEARGRTGGRLHTVDLAGAPVDMGGAWIHHPVGNPMSAFAEQVGVSRRSGNPLSGLIGFDCSEGRRLSTQEVSASVAMQFEAFPEALDRLRVALGPEASVADGIERFVGEAGLAPPAARRARQALHGLVEAEYADRAEGQSLRWIWNEIEYGGDFFGELPAGGYGSLVKAMATGVHLRLGAEVAEVVVSGQDVLVRCSNGTVEDGSHVVVTVPLGVLKRGAPQFSPALPPDRLAAITRLGFGRYEKVALRFEQPFWRAAGLSHAMLFPRDPGEATIWLFDESAFDGSPSLVCHVFHSAAGRVLDATPDETAVWVLGMLAEVAGAACPAPAAVAVSSWAADPYSGGAYTHIPIGASPADADLLGEPIHGRLLFAGEHTQSARLTYADGAMTSGIREAKRLLGQPGVRLGPIRAPDPDIER